MKNILEASEGNTLTTWACMGTEGELLVDDVVICDSRDVMLKYKPPGSTVIVTVEDGKCSVDAFDLTGETMEVSVTVNRGGVVLLGSTKWRQVYTERERTFRAIIPKEMDARPASHIYVPHNSILQECSFDMTDKAYIACGVPKRNRVYTVGGGSWIVDKFMSDMFDGIFMIRPADNIVTSLGLPMISTPKKFELVNGEYRCGNMKLLVADGADAPYYTASVFAPALEQEEEFTYVPFDLDGKCLIKENDRETSDGDTSLLVNELNKLLRNEGEIEKLAPLLDELVAALPPSIRNRGNLVSTVIRFACESLDVKAIKDKPKKENPRALPSNIL